MIITLLLGENIVKYFIELYALIDSTLNFSRGGNFNQFTYIWLIWVFFQKGQTVKHRIVYFSRIQTPKSSSFQYEDYCYNKCYPSYLN